MAGNAVFRRGEEYQARRCVRGLTIEGGRISACVYGSKRYRVVLMPVADKLGHECECPEGERGRFCKHCVAVSLELLGMEEDTGFEAYLKVQPAEKLIGFLLDELARNEGMRERLHLRMARERGEKADAARYSRMIELAYQMISTDSDEIGTAEILEDLGSSLRNLIESGYAEEATDLIEAAPTFSGRTEIAGGRELEELLIDLHRESCRRAGIVGDRLADRLLRWQLSAGGAIDSVVDYGHLLGRRGIKEYDRLIRAEWHGDQSGAQGNDRLSEILVEWAQYQGDVELLISVRCGRAQDASDFAEAVRLCRRAGRVDDAVEWARRGIEMFPAREAPDLYEFLAAEYEERGEWGEAGAMLLALFSARPSLEYYRRLEAVARRAGEWDRWRDRALSAAPGGSALVSILILEGDYDSALREARSGACDDEVLKDLAGRIAMTDPEGALDLYRRLVMMYAEGKNGYTYEKLIEVMRRMGRLMKKQNRREEYLEYVKGVREKYRRRYALVKMLDRLLIRHERRRRSVLPTAGDPRGRARR